jgi:hypothetical protein
MISKLKLTVIAAVPALSIAVPTVAMAQSAWTTGRSQTEWQPVTRRLITTKVVTLLVFAETMFRQKLV